MRIDAKPVETIVTPMSADDWWRIFGAAAGLVAAIGMGIS